MRGAAGALRRSRPRICRRRPSAPAQYPARTIASQRAVSATTLYRDSSGHHTAASNTQGNKNSTRKKSRRALKRLMSHSGSITRSLLARMRSATMACMHNGSQRRRQQPHTQAQEPGALSALHQTVGGVRAVPDSGSWCRSCRSAPDRTRADPTPVSPGSRSAKHKQKPPTSNNGQRTHLRYWGEQECGTLKLK